MKIAVMGTSVFGGLGTHYWKLLEFLIAEGHETFAFVVEDRPGAFSGPAGLAGMVRMPHESASIFQKLRKYAALVRGQRRMKRFLPQLFVATAPGLGYARMARCAKATGAFAVWQAVTCPPQDDALATEMCRAVDAVGVQTPGMLAPLQRAIAGASRGGWLPCLFEEPMTEAIAAAPPTGAPVRLAYFGRLVGNKGLVPFLRVFREVVRDGRVTLDIHGGGDERAAIEREIAALALGDSVSLKGRYPEGKDYGRLLSSYHALVLPSIACEGLPLVLLEAMNCGLPFLSTAIGGIADVARNNPDVLVVPPDSASLGAALPTLLSNLREGVISNARLKAFATSSFSNEKFAQTWREMLADPRAFFAEDVEPMRKSESIS